MSRFSRFYFSRQKKPPGGTAALCIYYNCNFWRRRRRTRNVAKIFFFGKRDPSLFLRPKFAKFRNPPSKTGGKGGGCRVCSDSGRFLGGWVSGYSVRRKKTHSFGASSSSSRPPPLYISRLLLYGPVYSPFRER